MKLLFRPDAVLALLVTTLAASASVKFWLKDGLLSNAFCNKIAKVHDLLAEHSEGPVTKFSEVAPL